MSIQLKSINPIKFDCVIVSNKNNVYMSDINGAVYMKTETGIRVLHSPSYTSRVKKMILYDDEPGLCLFVWYENNTLIKVYKTSAEVFHTKYGGSDIIVGIMYITGYRLAVLTYHNILLYSTQSNSVVKKFEWRGMSTDIILNSDDVRWYLPESKQLISFDFHNSLLNAFSVTLDEIKFIKRFNVPFDKVDVNRQQERVIAYNTNKGGLMVYDAFLNCECSIGEHKKFTKTIMIDDLALCFSNDKKITILELSKPPSHYEVDFDYNVEDIIQTPKGFLLEMKNALKLIPLDVFDPPIRSKQENLIVMDTNMLQLFKTMHMQGFNEAVFTYNSVQLKVSRETLQTCGELVDKGVKEIHAFNKENGFIELVSEPQQTVKKQKFYKDVCIFISMKLVYSASNGEYIYLMDSNSQLFKVEI